MYREFLSGWLQSASNPRTARERPTRPLSLWVYGRPGCRRAFQRELAAALKRTRRKTAFLGVADLKRLGATWEGDGASAEERRKLRSELLGLERAGVVVLAFDPGQLAGAVLGAVHRIVGARYNARKTTVILSRTDPAAAYQSTGKGQDRHTMP